MKIVWPSLCVTVQHCTAEELEPAGFDDAGAPSGFVPLGPLVPLSVFCFLLMEVRMLGHEIDPSSCLKGVSVETPGCCTARLAAVDAWGGVSDSQRY